MTNGPRRVPDKDKLEEYVARGLTHQQMADEWFAESGQQVQRATISMALARFGVTQPRRSSSGG